MKKYLYHLIIGSNLGDRAHQLSLAKKMITEEVGEIISQSQVYETQPWGYEDQPWFLNQVLKVNSNESPVEVLRIIKQIEIKAGRTAGEKWHARHIDIDILLCGDLVMENDDLVIPHPLLHTRNFVLIPLMEIDPQLIHPLMGKTIEELYLDSRDTGEVSIFISDEEGNSL